MTTTHGHRKYTMSEAARNQRRIARQARANNPRRIPASSIPAGTAAQGLRIVRYPTTSIERRLTHGEIAPLTIPRKECYNMRRQRERSETTGVERVPKTEKE